MTEDRHPTHAQLGLLLHHVLVDIRNWATVYQEHPEHAEAITGMTPAILAELGDLAEVIPLQLINPDEKWIGIIDRSVRAFAARYPFARRYAVALDAAPAHLRRYVGGPATAERSAGEPLAATT